MDSDYIQKSVKYRMGSWYSSSFGANRFPWHLIEQKKYVSRGGNKRYLHWIDRWKDLGINENIGLALDSQDAFFYADFVNTEQYSMLPHKRQKPVGSHNRHKSNDRSIIFPIKKQLSDCNFSKIKDPYVFKNKLDDVVWRGKFTGRPLDPNHKKSTWYHGSCPPDHYINYARYKAVSQWGKIFNIKFIPAFLALFNNKSYNEIIASEEFDRFSENSKIIIDNFYQTAIQNDMFGNYLDFEKEFCKYKYILNIDGHDSSSGIIHALQSNSVMISPQPQWHIHVNFELEAWKHYVPIADNLSDLDKKVEWCRENQIESKKISMRASEYISQFTIDSEKQIEKNIFKTLNQNAQ